jgi:hypothetical protein
MGSDYGSWQQWIFWSLPLLSLFGNSENMTLDPQAYISRFEIVKHMFRISPILLVPNFEKNFNLVFDEKLMETLNEKDCIQFCLGEKN